MTPSPSTRVEALLAANQEPGLVDGGEILRLLDSHGITKMNISRSIDSVVRRADDEETGIEWKVSFSDSSGDPKFGATAPTLSEAFAKASMDAARAVDPKSDPVDPASASQDPRSELKSP